MLWHGSADDFAAGDRIQSNDARIPIAAMFFPESHNSLHRMIRHIIIRINAHVKLGIDKSIGGIMRAMHSEIILVMVANLHPRLAIFDPSLDKLPRIVR